MRNLRDRDRKIGIRGETQHNATGRLRPKKKGKIRTFTPALAASEEFVVATTAS